MDQQPVASPAAPAPQPAPETLPNVPAEWPGGFGLYKFSKQAVMRNLGTLVALYAISFGIGLVLESILGQPGRILSELFALVISVTTIYAYLASVRGQKLSLGESFKKVQDAPILIWKYFLNSLVLAVVLIVSMLLLIVPFFIVFPRVILAQYFLLDKNLGPIEATKASWELTKGHSGKLWGVIGAGLAMALLFITIIGIPFAIYFLFMYSASLAVVYEFLNKTQPAVAQPVAATPVASEQPPVAPQA